MHGVWFFPFVKPTRDLQKCLRWVHACGRKGFRIENITMYTYICSLHFVGGFGPTEEHPDPIPATASCTVSYVCGGNCYGVMTRIWYR